MIENDVQLDVTRLQAERFREAIRRIEEEFKQQLIINEIHLTAMRSVLNTLENEIEEYMSK